MGTSGRQNSKQLCHPERSRPAHASPPLFVIPSGAGPGAPAVAAALVPAQPRDLGHCRGARPPSHHRHPRPSLQQRTPNRHPRGRQHRRLRPKQPLGHQHRPTPRAQDGASAGWTRVAGADFGATASQITPFDSDFYSVAFQDDQNGLFAGSRCQNPKDDTATCQRVPLIYRYSGATGTARELKRRPAGQRLSPKARLRRRDRLDRSW